MSANKTEDIQLGIKRLEYGDVNRPQLAVLTIETGKHYNGGIVSRASVFWVGRSSRCQLISMGGISGDFSKRLLATAKTRVTQGVVDKQHAEVFTPETRAQLVETAKSHYAVIVAAGVDEYKNTYQEPVNA